TYDHRIIQGAESGRFLQQVEALLQGENGFYEGVFADLGVTLPALPPLPQPKLAAAAVAPDGGPAPSSAALAAPAAAAPAAAVPAAAEIEELMQAVQAATSLLKAHRTHGHLAAHLDPLGRPPEGDPAF